MVPFAPEASVACLLSQSDVVPRRALLRLGDTPSHRAWAELVEGAEEGERAARDGVTDYLLRALETPTAAFEKALLADGDLVTQLIQRLSHGLPGSAYIRPSSKPTL
jgi:hypothetical protein